MSINPYYYTGTYYTVSRNGSTISTHRTIFGAWARRAWYVLTHRSR